jgi:hypothetical protein
VVAPAATAWLRPARDAFGWLAAGGRFLHGP